MGWPHQRNSDDTCVAILETRGSSSSSSSSSAPTSSPSPSRRARARLYFNEKVTADNTLYKGIHPVVSNQSHQASLAKLVQRALRHLPRRVAQEEVEEDQDQDQDQEPGAAFDPTTSIAVPSAAASFTVHRKPDFVTVTRGPGMLSSLATGLNTAKGLALAWSVPLLAVNHMQAHALTPRLVSALAAWDSEEPGGEKGREEGEGGKGGEAEERNEETETETLQPQFPFLSLLVSGGHTLLLHSTSLTRHRILASTVDVAVGDCIDKVARAILPADLVATSRDTNYGRMLEAFAFPAEEIEEEVDEEKKDDEEKEEEKEDALSQASSSSNRSSSNSSHTLAKNENEYAYPYAYTAPARRHDEITAPPTRYGWRLTPPLADASKTANSAALHYSFAGLDSQVRRVVETRSKGARKGTPEGTPKRTPAGSNDETEEEEEEEEEEEQDASTVGMDAAERRLLAREAMRVAFEHLAGRVVLALARLAKQQYSNGNDNKNNNGDHDPPTTTTTTTCSTCSTPIQTLVLSGGVASNRYLRHVLRKFLDARGFGGVRVVVPPVELCTDNAAMIAWCGVEMWDERERLMRERDGRGEARKEGEGEGEAKGEGMDGGGLEVLPRRKWGVDELE